MPFITGYLSNSKIFYILKSRMCFNALYHGLPFKRDKGFKFISKLEVFQCPLSRATFQTWRISQGDFKNWFQCPLSRATFQTKLKVTMTKALFSFNALYHGLPFKPYLWICPNLLGVTATLRGSSNLFF